MTTQSPDVEILSPESPSAPTVADPPPADSRCLHRYQNGTRCRLRGSESESGLCPRHFRLKVAAILPPAPDDSADLSGYLLRDLSKFSSAEDLREFLTRLLIQATKGRVSPRRAAVLAYITNQLLHSHCVVEKELDKESDKEPQIIFDLPRPKRDPIEDPERASYKSMAKYGTPVASETGIHSGPGASPGGLSTSGSAGPNTEKSK